MDWLVGSGVQKHLVNNFPILLLGLEHEHPNRVVVCYIMILVIENKVSRLLMAKKLKISDLSRWTDFH